MTIITLILQNCSNRYAGSSSPCPVGKTADPSTTLLRSSGRDDKERVVAYLRSCDWDVWVPGGRVVDFPAIGVREKANPGTHTPRMLGDIVAFAGAWRYG